MKKPTLLLQQELLSLIEVSIDPGRYVAAVSGGVDSMALLDILRQKPGVQLVVAHLDHGIRPDSDQDRQLVQRAAKQYGLPFIYKKVSLPLHVSEDTARKVRYDFLRSVQMQYNAKAIITAHHQDDLLETVFINLVRGTGRRGLTALRSTPQLLRPLLSVPKQALIAYATERGIAWHEDSTNTDESYLRNRIRRQVMPKLSVANRNGLLERIDRQQHLNHAIDDELQQWVARHVTQHEQYADLPRYQLTMLPAMVAFEVLQYVCKQLQGNTIQTAQAWRALAAAKSLQTSKKHAIAGGLQLQVLSGGTVRLNRIN